MCQCLSGEQSADLPGENTVQTSWRHHQHRRPGHGVPQRIPCVTEGGEGRLPPAQTHPGRDQFSPDALSGSRPEDHCQHQIGCGGGNQQNLRVHICVKHTVHHRHTAACQHTQCQHTPGHGAGDGKQQQCQPQQLFLSPIGHQRHENPGRQLHRRSGEKSQSRQKRRHGVSSAQQACQKIPPPPEGDPGQTPHGQYQQIVHQGVQHEHTVYVYHGQGPLPLPADGTIIGQAPGKFGRKKETHLGKGASPPSPIKSLVLFPLGPGSPR